jgi:hypothetical protein
LADTRTGGTALGVGNTCIAVFWSGAGFAANTELVTDAYPLVAVLAVPAFVADAGVFNNGGVSEAADAVLVCWSSTGHTSPVAWSLIVKATRAGPVILADTGTSFITVGVFSAFCTVVVSCACTVFVSAATITIS